MVRTTIAALFFMAIGAGVLAQARDAGTPPTFAVASVKPSAPASVFTAVQEQLGLKLEPRKEGMDVLVIDQVAMPTPN